MNDSAKSFSTKYRPERGKHICTREARVVIRTTVRGTRNASTRRSRSVFTVGSGDKEGSGKPPDHPQGWVWRARQKSR